MAQNCSSLDSWAFRPSFSDTCWISENFARETEALTKALQVSLSDDSVPVSETLSATNLPSFLNFVKPESAVSASDPDSGPKRFRNPVPCASSGKITKRKSRASKRSPITFITADPANFRQMVQEVTGIRFGDSNLQVEPVFKPEPQRPGGNRVVLQQSCLPTLDTSAFLLDRSAVVGSGSLGPAVECPGFDFEAFSSFPTLESWGVM